MRVYIFLLLLSFSAHAQVRQQSNASELLLRLKKLNVLGSVLYIAAHPDDENTRAIAYFSNDRLFTTAYLSLTRGDGGQNLIGAELRHELGVIRTQELLAARKIDGGEQYFTRANDFGFSKNHEETLTSWGKEEILADVVYIIRKFQPDVIITRFPPDARAGHGHHTSSAILAEEAFDLAASPNAFPEQLKSVKPWQTKSLYTNTGRWWNQTIDEKTPGIVSINVGTYNALLGKSSAEIAAESRSQHKSQGFGSSGRRGDALELFEYVKGDKVKQDFFESVSIGWDRIPNGAAIGKNITKLIKSFQPQSPATSIPALLKEKNQINALAPSVWKDRKLAEVNQLIQDCLGLYVEVSTPTEQVSPGQMISASIEVINRSSVNLTLKQIKSNALAWDIALMLSVAGNQLHSFDVNKKLGLAAGYSDPFWLRSQHRPGIFNLPDPSYIGKAENDPAVQITFTFSLLNEPFEVTVPVVYKITDPVKGEVTQPLAVVPPVSISLTPSVYVWKDQRKQRVTVTMKSVLANASGNLKLALPDQWTSSPEALPFQLTSKNAEQSFQFDVLPAASEGTFSISAFAEIDGKRYDQSIQIISYDHIPRQTLLTKAESKAIRMDIQTTGNKVAYIQGAGDEAPMALRQLGYDVWEMKNEEVTAANLKNLQAVVLGIRALNTNDRIRFIMPALLNYVAEGGTLIIQYNNNAGLEIEPTKFSPFPITLSRERVTEENSEVRILLPNHRVLNSPNKITSQDFKGWVQERGLYFPSAWDAAYETPLSMNDTKAAALNGSLLVARYGKGHYVYTALSFFRELPEGVSGAYKLFANLVSLSPVEP